MKPAMRPRTHIPPSVFLGVLLAGATLVVGGCVGDDPEPPPADETTASPEVSPETAAVLAEARRLLRAQNFSQAEQQLLPIVESEPGNGQARLLLAAALTGKGDHAAALAALDEALAIAAVEQRARYQRAQVLAQLGRSGEALGELETLDAEGRFNLTQITLDNQLESLRDDPRFAALLPGPDDFRDPFVEDVRVVHEWRSEKDGERHAYGWIARNIGDVDGDGVGDVITSAPGWNSGAGRVYAYSGAGGELLWTADGDEGDGLGTGVEAAGDVDANGVPDVVAGAPGGERAVLYDGRSGRVLRVLEGIQEGEAFGGAVSDIGDVDGDGHADVLVGAASNDTAGEDAGRAAVYSGRDGAVLFEVHGERPGALFGSAVGGHPNAGRPLLVVGAPGAGPEQRGRAYVYRATDGAVAAEPLFVADGDDTAGAYGGMFVSVVGDVDADGALDVYISDWSNGAGGTSTGRVYVYSGTDGGLLHTLTGEAAGDGFGIGSADVGDIDGDGHDDLVIGAWQQASAAPSGGKVYIYSGRDASLIRAITCRTVGDTFGFDATGLGDVDGDGSIDLLLTSAWSAVHGARSGRMFVISSAPPVASAG